MIINKNNKDFIEFVNGKKSCLYVIGCGDMMKIGITNNPKSRLLSLSNANISQLNLIRLFEYNVDKYSAYQDQYKDVEKKLHVIFDKYRIKGEWFNLKDRISKLDAYVILNFVQIKDSVINNLFRQYDCGSIVYAVELMYNISWFNYTEKLSSNDVGFSLYCDIMDQQIDGLEYALLEYKYSLPCSDVTTELD